MTLYDDDASAGAVDKIDLQNQSTSMQSKLTMSIVSEAKHQHEGNHIFAPMGSSEFKRPTALQRRKIRAELGAKNGQSGNEPGYVSFLPLPA